MRKFPTRIDYNIVGIDSLWNKIVSAKGKRTLYSTVSLKAWLQLMKLMV